MYKNKKILYSLLLSSFLISESNACSFKTAKLIMDITHSEEKACKYGPIIAKVAKLNKIDPKLLIAIFYIESSINTNTVSNTFDYGIGQINKIKIDEYGFDKDRLLSDLEYSISSSVKILKDINKRYKHEPNWYTRYHSNTPSKRSLYLDRLKPIILKIYQ